MEIARNRKIQKLFLISISLMITASLLVYGCSSQRVISDPRLVELWVSGDDGLTQRLADALDKELKTSSDFSMSSGKKPGTLVITIPTHVQWKDIGKRTQVFYTVEFSSISDQIIGASTGSCWDGEFKKCADQIMLDTKKAASRIH
jgi:hypothetical protein